MGSTSIALGIIVQARMGSTRLPGKIFAPIGGRPLLEHILARLATLRHQAHVVIATTDGPKDDVVATFCAARGVDCFRGSEADVLARYYQCATARGFAQVVRLTADNPFTDVDELDRLIDLHIDGRYDFSGSFQDLPIGVGAEIMAMAALEQSYRLGHEPHHREHVDEYILDHPALFRIGRLEAPLSKRRPEVRMTVDTAEDLHRACFVADHSASPLPTTEEVIDLCSRFV